MKKFGKHYIYEGFSFDDDDAADEGERISADDLKGTELYDEMMKNTDILRVLASMGIRKPQNSSVQKDADGCDVLICTYMNARLIKKGTWYFDEDVPQIKEFVAMLLKSYGWRYEMHRPDDSDKAYPIGEWAQFGNVRAVVSKVLVSPDNGLVLTLFKPNTAHPADDNVKVYHFGWAMQLTKQVQYFDKLGNAPKKVKKIQYNVDGGPLVPPTKEEAEELYLDYWELGIAINAYSSEYYSAWAEKHNRLNALYKPYNDNVPKAQRDEYYKKMKEWEASATVKYKRNRPEYQELQDKQNECKKKMRAQMTAKDMARVNFGRKGMHFDDIYKKKWCPSLEDPQWYPIWRRYKEWWEKL